MKVDESCINHNALRLIKYLTDSNYEIKYEEKEMGYMLMTLGEIRGVIDLADALKEVLKE